MPKPKPPIGKPVPGQSSPEVQKTLSPKREASQRLVQIGQSYLDSAETDKAVQTFQEAINIDSENGIAYFYLAKSLMQKGNYDDALNLLDRAETFLAGQENWQDKIGELRVTIKDVKEGRVILPGAAPQTQSMPQGVYY